MRKWISFLKKSVLVAVLLVGQCSLFGGAKIESTTLNAPKPTVSKGSYSSYVKITWKKVSGAQGYYIKRGTSKTFSKAMNLTKLNGGSKTSFKDSSATRGKKYYYWVCPYKNGYYYYKTSSYAQGWRKGSSSTLTPPKPSASKGTHSSYVKITWKKVSGAQGYYIKRGTSKTFSKAKTLKKLKGASKTSCKDTKAAKGKKYYYWVCPYKGKYYYYNSSRCVQGWRKGATSSSSSSYTISGSSKVTLARSFKLTFKKGGKSLVGDWYCSSSKVYLMSNTRGRDAQFMALLPGTVTINVFYGGRTFSKKVTITDGVGNNSGGTGISGPNSLSNGQTGTYSLRVSGKTITSGVSWSYSSGLRRLSVSGGKIKVYPKYASSPNKKRATISATYKGKKYSKTIDAYY